MEKYCTQIHITEKVRLDLFTGSSFRVRTSKLNRCAFPERYEIPFAVGKTKPWKSVKYEKSINGCTVIVKTATLIIKLRALDGYMGANFSVYDVNGERLYPVDAPKYGMFINKCIVFDSASFFNEYSGCSRYAHAFYDNTKGEYSIMLDKDAILDIFFIYGKTYKDGYAKFNELVGAEPLLPKKAYGGHQTQHLGAAGSQRLLLQTAKLLRERSVPCDHLIVDFEWGDGADDSKEVVWGSRLDWSSEYCYPLSPKQMIDELNKLHFDVSLIHHSIPDYANRIDEDWVNYPCDSHKWWKSIDRLIADGIKGTWQDTRQTDITDSYVYKGFCEKLACRPYFIGNYDVYYDSNWTTENYLIPVKQRIGGRRYPFRWTGDMSYDSWDELAFQIKAITNTEGALKGISYITNDDMRSGGVCIGARSAQFLCFNSVMRSHNTKPWESEESSRELAARMAIIGKTDSTVQRSDDEKLLGLVNPDIEKERIIRKYLKLRYRLIPYIYTAARQTYDSGLPITRPLMIEFEDDENCNKNQYPRQYMFGDKLLVCPVYSDSKTMSVYLPCGDWIDFFTGNKFTGGREIEVDISILEKMPIFVRNGSVVTTWDECDYIDPTEVKTVNIEVFGEGEDTVSLYEDDGTSFGYKNGEYAFTEIKMQADKDGISIIVFARQGQYIGAPRNRKFALLRNGNRIEFDVDTRRTFEHRFEI